MQLRALVAEFIGTAFLLAGGAGSGIMAERLSNDAGMVQNAAATAGVLLVIINMFAPCRGRTSSRW